MVSPERRKGSAFELEIVKYLQMNGFRYAERAYGAGRPDDRGDIDGIPGWVLEAKAHKSLDLAGWADEAAAAEKMAAKHHTTLTRVVVRALEVYLTANGAKLTKVGQLP